MNIGVQSFPELYTMLMGWHLYDQLWTLLSQTGIAFLPFIGIILRNIKQPYESQETKDAASTSLRRMEMDIIGTLLIIFLGVSPFIPLKPSTVSYSPVCQVKGQNNTYHPGDTNTTWDIAFTQPTEAYVPLWWMAVMSISEGFASSANTMVACVPDLRKMVTEVNMSQLTDPTLKQEMKQFELNCYIPARTAYLEDAEKNSSSLQNINQDREKYGTEDTEWIGSHGFQDTYYQNLHAQQPVQGFPYNPSEDINADTNKSNPPAYGTPSCSDWWNDPQNGLKNKLYTALPKDFGDEFKDFFKDDSTGALKDDVIKRIALNEGYQKANNTVGDDGYSNVTTAVGSWFTQLSTYPKLYAAAQSAPIIQALLLLMIYTFLPFALVFSGYKPATFITGAAIIFSMIFWSFIWHLVSYVDSALMNALYGDRWFAKQSPSATMADMITGTLILVAPLFWFSFMGAMGVAVGDLVMKAVGGMSGVGDGAAQAGTGLAKKAATIALSAAAPVAGTAGKAVMTAAMSKSSSSNPENPLRFA